MLSCSCDYDDEPIWHYYSADDFKKFDKNKRKRCCSCKKLIDKESLCLEFERFRYPRTDIEERIYTCEIPLASFFMCERCGEIYLNLEAIGFCISIEDDMEECLSEYHQLTGFKKD